MPITQAQAQAITMAFTRQYPGALALAYRFRESLQELYREQAATLPQDIKGGYVAQKTMFNGRLYHGRVDWIYPCKTPTAQTIWSGRCGTRC